MWNGTPDVARGGGGRYAPQPLKCCVPVTGDSRLRRAPEGNICLGREKGTRARSPLLLCDHVPAHTNRSLEATAVGGFTPIILE